MEEVAALFVAILFGTVGLLGLRLVKDSRERNILIRLFATAFTVRLVFTSIFYETGLVNALGGADDTVWIAMWERSRSWTMNGPEPLYSIFNPKIMSNNPGFAYFGSLFYYVLNVRSQLALAVLNCFLSALVVIVVYKAAREFFSQQACTFVARVAVFMPMFLIWSALTVKETWLILLEITIFYAIWRFCRHWKPANFVIYGSLAILGTLLTLSLRFYAFYLLLMGITISLLCCRARRPVLAAGCGVFAFAVLFAILSAAQIIQIDLAAIAQTRAAEMEAFRANVSDPNQLGTGSAIQFDFDTTTLEGFILMLLAGSVYLLFSPFPWQIRSVSQMAALPDVLLWWWLVFIFIIPGIGYAWNKRPAIVLSVGAFVLPLFLLYAFMFGNVGLAYRQRAQLVPFLLILAAAGYEKRQMRKLASRKKTSLGRSTRFEVQQPAIPAAKFEGQQ